MGAFSVSRSIFALVADRGRAYLCNRKTEHQCCERGTRRDFHAGSFAAERVVLPAFARSLRFCFAIDSMALLTACSVFA